MTGGLTIAGLGPGDAALVTPEVPLRWLMRPMCLAMRLMSHACRHAKD
jgi:hypothetical protein